MKKDRKPFALFVTDIHLTKDNGEIVKNIWRQCIKVCKENEVKKIICGGDIFTNRSGQPLSCLTDFKEMIRLIQCAGIRMSVIAGNHDKTDPDSKLSYLSIFDNDIKVHNVGGLELFSRKLEVAYIPYFTDEVWMENYERVMDIIYSQITDGDIDADAVKFLITHSGFDGVKNNDGTKVVSIIKPSMFKEDWNKVLIGHYHNASKLSDNVIYTGSLYQNNYGETINDKGATLMFTDGSIEHVELDFPKYINVKLDVNDSEGIRDSIEKYKNSQNHIRFTFSGKKVDADKVDAVGLSKLGIETKFVAEETTEAMQSSESDELMVYDKKTILKHFSKFCAENGIKGKNLKYGLNLIREL